jgi:hypothetical protein
LSKRLKIAVSTSHQKSTEQSSGVEYSSRLNKIATKTKSKPKKVYNDNYLYDLNKTMQINLKVILDITKEVNMEQQKKNLIIKRIKIINKLYDKYYTLRKEKTNIKSKQLVNNQIIGEIKRRMVETSKFYDDKINDINSVINKKVIYLKKSQKKFNEIQIYIRRESQNFPRYKKIFANFLIKSFILENESLMRYKKKLNEEEDKKKVNIRIIHNEINEMKNQKKKRKKDGNHKENNKNIIVLNKTSAKDKLNSYLIGLEEGIKYSESLNDQLSKIRLVYQRKFFPRNDYCKGIDSIKYSTIINTDFSQDTYYINEVSVSAIKRVNNEENLESNISNTFYDILNTENFKNSIQDD